MNAEKVNSVNVKNAHSEKADIEQLLQSGQTIQICPRGYSMYPMLVPGRDEVIIKPAVFQELKRGDVVLYRREESILVLHRIYKIKNNEFYMVGDNQAEVEGPLQAQQIKGCLTGFIRKGKSISAKNPLYLIASHVWLILLPFRNPLKRIAARLKRVVMKQHK